MQDKTLAISVKVKIIQTMVFPNMTYGNESRTVMKDRRKIDAFELWCWRRACRVKWTDKVSNKSILTWVAPYDKLSLDARILKLKMSYFGHVMRRNGMEKDIMLGKVGGRRRRGRQRMRWMEGILTETGNGLKELRELVESRHESVTSLLCLILDIHSQLKKQYCKPQSQCVFLCDKTGVVVDLTPFKRSDNKPVYVHALTCYLTKRCSTFKELSFMSLIISIMIAQNCVIVNK